MAKFQGKKVFIKVDLNGVGGSGANWMKLGQQTTGGLDGGTELQDARTKDDSGWPGNIATGITWSVNVEFMLDPGSSVYQYIRNAWRNTTSLYIQIDRSLMTGLKEEGVAWIASLNENFDQTSPVKGTVQFTGEGPLTTSP